MTVTCPHCDDPVPRVVNVTDPISSPPHDGSHFTCRGCLQHSIFQDGALRKPTMAEAIDLQFGPAAVVRRVLAGARDLPTVVYDLSGGTT